MLCTASSCQQFFLFDAPFSLLPSDHATPTVWIKDQAFHPLARGSSLPDRRCPSTCMWSDPLRAANPSASLRPSVCQFDTFHLDSAKHVKLSVPNSVSDPRLGIVLGEFDQFSLILRNVTYNIRQRRTRTFRPRELKPTLSMTCWMKSHDSASDFTVIWSCVIFSTSIIDYSFAAYKVIIFSLKVC